MGGGATDPMSHGTRWAADGRGEGWCSNCKGEGCNWVDEGLCEKGEEEVMGREGNRRERKDKNREKETFEGEKNRDMQRQKDRQTEIAKTKEEKETQSERQRELCKQADR